MTTLTLSTDVLSENLSTARGEPLRAVDLPLRDLLDELPEDLPRLPDFEQVLNPQQADQSAVTRALWETVSWYEKSRELYVQTHNAYRQLRDVRWPKHSTDPELSAEGGRIRAKLVMSFDVARANFINIEQAYLEYADNHSVGPAEAPFWAALRAGDQTFERHLGVIEGITSRLESAAHEEHLRLRE
jgi:hypothetical protein